MSEKQKRYLKDDRFVNVRINSSLGDLFDEKLKNSEFSKKDVIETAISAYVNGEAKKFSKNGEVLRMSCKSEKID